MRRLQSIDFQWLCGLLNLLFLLGRFDSKLQSEALREAITQIVADCKEKKRNFTETIELQIGLKNYDPQKDKRFSGSVRLPHIPRPKMKICMLGDAQHVEEVQIPLLFMLFSRKDPIVLHIFTFMLDPCFPPFSFM